MHKRHIVVVDPALSKAEIDAYNQLVELSPLPLTYHLPALFGANSLQRETQNIAGIVIFGSAASVNDALPWQQAIAQWLQPLLHRKTPTLGICYGHQFLAHLFGSAVQRRWPAENKRRGFRKVRLEKNRLWGEAQSGELFMSHGEVVTNCPKDFQIVASSAEVYIEALAHSELPIWSFQAHPEATPIFTGDSDQRKLVFGHSLVQAFLSFTQK